MDGGEVGGCTGDKWIQLYDGKVFVQAFHTGHENEVLTEVILLLVINMGSEYTVLFG